MKYLRYGLCAGAGLLKRKGYFDKVSKNPDQYPLEERFEKAKELVIYANKKALHMHFYISGTENIPDEACFFFPNHTSLVDPLILIDILPSPVAFVAKKEVEDMMIIGNVLKAIDGKFIDRNDLRSELKVFKEVEKTLDKEPNLSYAIFPEGTRSKAPDFPLQEFHPGSFRIPVNRNMPIVPVALYFTDRVMNPKYHYHKYPIQVSFLQPIYPEDLPEFTTKDFAHVVRDLIREELVRLKLRDRELVQKENGYSDKKLDKVLFLK